MTSLTYAQEEDMTKYEIEIQEISSPSFEWTQFDNDNAKCKYKKEHLVLECKKDKHYTCTTTELDFNVTDADFIISYKLNPEDFDDDHPFGIVFDYENAKNFQCLCFGKKKVQLVHFKNGEQAVVKEGLFKTKNKKDVLVTMKKKGKRLDFYLGETYFPLLTIKRSSLEHPNFGFYIENKTKLVITGLGYKLLFDSKDEETE